MTKPQAISNACEVIKPLNKKPVTSNPCEMRTIMPGTALLVGKGTQLCVEKHINRLTCECIYFLKTTGTKANIGDMFDVSSVLNFEQSGIKITPISMVLNGDNAGNVHLFVEQTKTLQEILNPAS